MRFKGALLTMALLIAALPTQAALCPKWGASSKIGELNATLIDEASGLSLSPKSETLYLVNDSGSDFEFFATARDGSKPVKISVEGPKPYDVEELSVGLCPIGTATCVVLGDIGDNRRRRKVSVLTFIEEQSPFPLKVKPLKTVKFKYPDGSHDAEAMSLLPNGDLVIVTKEETAMMGQAKPAHVFRARRSELAGKASPIVLTKLGEIPIPEMVKNTGFGGRVTAMSVTSDGRRFALLTYSTAVEFELDLAGPFPSKFVEGVDYRVVSLSQLPQQESVTYDRGDRDLIYTTESLSQIFGVGSPVPLYKVSCAP